MPINKSCFFCQEKINTVDYKNAEDLHRFTNSYGQILPKRRTGLCAKHQRQFTNAVKLARIMALSIFTNK